MRPAECTANGRAKRSVARVRRALPAAARAARQTAQQSYNARIAGAMAEWVRAAAVVSEIWRIQRIFHITVKRQPAIRLLQGCVDPRAQQARMRARCSFWKG